RRLTETSAAQPFARYYVENAPELLDEPGEWYLDRAGGVLSYLPKPGETPARTAAVVPACDALVRLAGRPEKGEFIEHVSFRGLRFEHWERWPDRADPCDVQAAANVPAGISCEGARRCAFERCTVAHGSGYGLHLARGCRACRVDHCELFDLGAGGIQIGEMRIPAGDADLTAGNAVTDCHLHDLGRVFPQGV